MIDWKTSSRPRPSLSLTYDSPVQTAAYAGAVNQDPHYPFKVSLLQIALSLSLTASQCVFEIPAPVSAHVCIHAHTHTHTCTHAHAHTHTHTQTHKHTHSSAPGQPHSDCCGLSHGGASTRPLPVQRAVSGVLAAVAGQSGAVPDSVCC